MFNWINFLAYVSVSAGTPGPNNIMSMSNGSRLGFKKAIPFNFGVLAGCSITMTICALFCSVLSEVIPKIQTPMQIAGACYMLYLAWKTFKSSSISENEDSKSDFLSGFLLQFVNPKTFIYGIVSMQSFIIPVYGNNYLVLFLFALLLALLGFSFTLLWLLFGSTFKILFSKYSKITNTIMALLLVYCAISIFF